jgi:hypothetical protein
MPGQRHGPRVELPGDPPHADRLRSLGLGHLDRRRAISPRDSARSRPRRCAEPPRGVAHAIVPAGDVLVYDAPCALSALAARSESLRTSRPSRPRSASLRPCPRTSWPPAAPLVAPGALLAHLAALAAPLRALAARLRALRPSGSCSRPSWP